MFRRGKKDDDDDDLNSLRGDFTVDDSGDLPHEDDDASFLNDVAPGGIEEEDEEEQPRRGRRQRTRMPGRVGLIGGFFRVIGTAILALLIFLLIGIGIAFGAGALGAIQLLDVSAISVPQIALAPTELPPTPVPATAAPVIDATPAEGLAPVPTATPPDVTLIAATPIRCDDLAAWWNQQAPIYQSFAALSVESPPQTLLATLQQLRIRRDSARNTVVTPCVGPVRNAFVAGYDNLISAFETLSGGDQNAARSISLMAGQAFAQGLSMLWSAGIATEGSPPADVVAGSAAQCGAAAWYGAAQTQRSAFINAYLAVRGDESMAGAAIRQNQNTMQAARDNVAALNAPACVAEPSRLLLAYMDDQFTALARHLADNPAEGESLESAGRSQIMLDAWLYYLGVTP